MSAAALLIIDVQKGMFVDPNMLPFDGAARVARMRTLSNHARAADAPVISIKHDGGPGHPLDAVTPDHAIVDALTPAVGEHVVTKTQCSAFLDTGLADHLRAISATELIICGIQTDYCVDTTVRAALEHGFKPVIALDAHTTYDTPDLQAPTIIAHHNRIWAANFGTVLPSEEIQFT